MTRKIFLLMTLIVVISFSVLTAGCLEDVLGTSEPTENFTLPPNVQQAARQVNEKVPVDVYFDATVSMKGYTTLAAGNVYRTLPDILTDVGSSMGEVNFYKFSEQITLLENRDYRNYSSPAPYYEIVTAIQNVVAQANPAHLSVIVTDLFESDSDWSSMARQIRTKYFDNHLAVAVIGIKNSFNGEVFDVGLNAAKFDYNSNDNTALFRPFYLMILGQEADITRFMEKFKERQTLPNETHYLMLSENLSTANDFSSMPMTDLQNFYNTDKLKLGNNGVKEFGLDKFAEPASLTVQFTYKPQLGACPLNMEEIVPDVKILVQEGEEWQPLDSNDVNVTLTPIEGNPNSFDVTVSMTPERSLREGKYNFVHISLSPTEKGYMLPEWVRNWNMPNVDVDKANFDGSKTINLVHVIGSLKDSVFATAPLKLIDMNFVVDAH